MSMRAYLERVLDGGDLSQADAGSAMGLLTDEAVDPLLKSAFLAALRTKGETADELRGFALAMRDAARALPIDVTGPLVDTCGTGGDGSHSINISTAASLVVAACGVAVVKHGNRSVSSKSGSADVLEALGISLPPTPDAAAAYLSATGWTFLFAPAFHPAMKAVVPVRRALGVRTVFNMLGPLTNPARPPYQLIGAFSEKAAELMAYSLAGVPAVARASVVHGYPGWDEATPVGPFIRFDVEGGTVTRREVDPERTYGVGRCTTEDLAGGDAVENAACLRRVFEAEQGAHRDAIVLNAALVLELLEPSLGSLGAMARAAEAIDSGGVTKLLADLSRLG